MLFVSIDGSSWSNTVNLILKDGRGTVHIKGSDGGKSSIVVGGENSESNKLVFEFYISKSQKRTLEGKLSSIAEKKGFSDISQFIAGKSLKSTTVRSGVASIDVVLQKVDTGELEIINTEQIENPDGTVSVVLIIKPRSKGGN